jgi:tetratricopeptide (TPR) repeat protein
MSNTIEILLNHLDEQLKYSLHQFEEKGNWDSAQISYKDVERQLDELHLSQDDPTFPASQAVLAFCLQRQGNVFRQQKQTDQAIDVGRREIAASRASGNPLILSRSLLDNGAELIVSGNLDEGIRSVQEARSLLEKGEDFESQQGLGWYWILRADLANARVIPADPEDIVDAANTALDILLPIMNWEGVTRAYAARAVAYDALGAKDAAERDRQTQARYLRMINDQKPSRT